MSSINPEKKKGELIIRLMPNGDTKIDFFPVEFSEFIIDYVMSKEERERMALTGCRRIYCG